MVQVSVLMPSFNHQSYISEAIESVLNQTFTDLELIVVDDCSKDCSPKIIRSYQEQDNRVSAFFHERNLGIARTVNDCIHRATGKYVAFIDSDDLWAVDKLERQIRVLENNENAVVWSEGEIINRNGIFNGLTFTKMHAASGKERNGKMFRDLIDDNFVDAQSLIVKKENVHDWDSGLKYLNDYKFLVDLAYRHDFVFIPQPLVKYRIHGKNSILTDRNGWLKDRIALRGYFLERYGSSLSSNQKGVQYLKISEALSNLGNEEAAKQFYLKALKVNPCSKETLLYLAHTLPKWHGLLVNLIFAFYVKLTLISHFQRAVFFKVSEVMSLTLNKKSLTPLSVKQVSVHQK